MDSTSGKTDKPKLEELSREQLIHLLNEAMDRLKNANERIETLEKKLTDTLPPKLPVPYSVRSAEERKKRKKELDRKNKEKKKPLRSGCTRSLQKNQSISEDERESEIVKLEDRVLALCSVREIETEKLDDATAYSFRLLRKELLGLSLREELFTFVSNPAVAPTNNEAERTLRDPATARRVGRTNKTLRGARRQTIIKSVFESIRTQLPKFTLQGVLDEISSWKTQGESCFTRLLNAAGLTPNEASVLDKIFPNKGKPLPAQLAAS